MSRNTMDRDVIQAHNVVKLIPVLFSAIIASFQSLFTLVTIYRGLTFSTGARYQLLRINNKICLACYYVIIK